MEVILIRHGMTAGNARRRYIGRTDLPLSEEGAALARAAGSDPGVRTVYVTPLRRTRQTAAILFPNARQITVDGLREMEFGDFENRSAAEMADDPAYRAWVDSDCLAPCPNGESRSEFCARVCAAFCAALDDAAARGAERAVFVVHGGTIMSVLFALDDCAGAYYSYACGNCGGWRCEARQEGGTWVLTDVERVERKLENDL